MWDSQIQCSAVVGWLLCCALVCLLCVSASMCRVFRMFLFSGLWFRAVFFNLNFVMD